MLTIRVRYELFDKCCISYKYFIEHYYYITFIVYNGVRNIQRDNNVFFYCSKYLFSD